jgi:hypothetical protein
MTEMKIASLLLPLLLLLPISGCSKPPETPVIQSSRDTQKNELYKKELEEIRKSIKSDLKIKLKKDGKGDAYSWEISGKDAGEILRANDILSKKLTPK